MSQDKVFKLLKRSKKPLTPKEINKILGIGTAGASLKKMRERGEIKWKSRNNKQWHILEYWI